MAAHDFLICFSRIFFPLDENKKKNETFFWINYMRIYFLINTKKYIFAI